MAMTLNEARLQMAQACTIGGPVPPRFVAGWLEAINAHLTQPAQAVDVVALRSELYGIAADNHKSALTLGQEGLRGQCIETSKRLREITRALAGEQAGWPRVCGTSRVADNAKCLLVSFEREPTNNELVAFDDAIKAASPTPDKEW